MKVTDGSPNRVVVVLDTSAVLAAQALSRRSGLLAFSALPDRDAGARTGARGANAALVVPHLNRSVAGLGCSPPIGNPILAAIAASHSTFLAGMHLAIAVNVAVTVAGVAPI